MKTNDAAVTLVEKTVALEYLQLNVAAQSSSSSSTTSSEKICYKASDSLAQQNKTKFHNGNYVTLIIAIVKYEWINKQRKFFAAQSVLLPKFQTIKVRSRCLKFRFADVSRSRQSKCEPWQIWRIFKRCFSFGLFVMINDRIKELQLPKDGPK